MESERVIVKLLVNDVDIVSTQLELFEEIPDEQDIVAIELKIDGRNISSKSENFFDALLNLRKELEKRSIQILCNGAAENIYPSPMQLSMGTGRAAYKQNLGQQARMSDVVDIFEYDGRLNFVSIEAQLKFHNEWLKSITG